MDLATYRRLRARAARLSRRAADADDLLQDALLAARRCALA
jgi:DNA-directed RNA polymerase specialized sigma24 family protein